MLPLILLVAILVTAVTAMRRRGAPPEKELIELRERMLRLEQSLETMTADMERVSEGQRFLTALLEERARNHPAIKPSSPPAPPPEA